MEEYGMEVTASNYFMADWDVLAEPFSDGLSMFIIFLVYWVLAVSIAPLVAYSVYWTLDDTDQGKLVA